MPNPYAAWSCEKAHEDDGGGFYIKRDGKAVAVANDEGWADYIIGALIRDQAAHHSVNENEPPKPDIEF